MVHQYRYGAPIRKSTNKKLGWVIVSVKTYDTTGISVVLASIMDKKREVYIRKSGRVPEFTFLIGAPYLYSHKLQIHRIVGGTQLGIHSREAPTTSDEP
jgi:hypothetical protein